MYLICQCILCAPQVLQLDDSSPTLRVAPETFNVRLEELTVIDMAFLAPSGAQSAAAGSSAAAAAAAKPVIALLYEDNKQARHVKTYMLNLETKVRAATQNRLSSTRCHCSSTGAWLHVDVFDVSNVSVSTLVADQNWSKLLILPSLKPAIRFESYSMTPDPTGVHITLKPVLGQLHVS